MKSLKITGIKGSIRKIWKPVAILSWSLGLHPMAFLANYFLRLSL
jgi:hypothetical protein